MAWYDPNKVPEWKTFIANDYNIENLLRNKDLLLKQLPQEELQAYLQTHKHQIVQDALTLSLGFPAPEASYDRKYLWPTLAIELLTNKAFFSVLGWEQSLVQEYLGCLMARFSSVDPHYDNVNLYHGYFQRLLLMVMGCDKVNREELMLMIQEEQRTNNFIGSLLKHIHKYSMVICLSHLLNGDWADPTTVTLDFKQQIFTALFQCLSQQLTGRSPSRAESIENMLTLLKSYLEEGIKLMASSVLSSDQRVKTFKEMYSTFQKQYPMVVEVIKTEETSLKMVALQVVQLNELLLVRVKNRDIDQNWNHVYRRDLMDFMLGQPVGITSSLFIQWLIILCSDVGENALKIQLLIASKAVQRLIGVMDEQRANSIVVVRVIEFLKVIFINIEKQALLSIERHKNVDISLIEFRLFGELFESLPTLQEMIRSFRSFNQLLFTHLVKLIKLYNTYSINLENIFNHYNMIPLCAQSKTKIEELLLFYQQQPCFAVYDHELSKELGTVYPDSVFQTLLPLDYSVKKVVQLSDHSQPSQTQPPQITIKVPAPAPPPSPLSQTATALTPSQSTAVQIKLNDELLKEVSDESWLNKAAEQGEIVREVKASANNMEDLEDSFDTYKRKKLEEAEKIITEKRSKSRTPTKMKNEIKKSKNKWSNSQASLNQENQSFSCEHADSKPSHLSSSPPKIQLLKEALPAKISIIKLNNHRKLRSNKERVVEGSRDSRLMGWLRVLREVR